MTVRHPLAALFLIPILPAVLGACARSSGDPDPVSGNWTGAWYRSGEKLPAGRLSFRVSPEGPEAWQAVVEVSSGVDAIYEFTLRGRREGTRVLFGGEIDLGRAGGGVYGWSGEADGSVFQGVYRHPTGDGRFELVRRPEPESVVPEGPPAPAAPEPDPA